MPITVKKTTGGPAYSNPMVGPVDHTAGIDVALSGLSSDEIDAKGWLKPGVPLTREGTLVGAMTKSVPGSATAGGDNFGDGTVGSVTGRFGAPTETITLTCTAEDDNAGTFRVEGSKSGHLGNATVGVAFDSDVIGFTIADGSEDFDVDDVFTFEVTGGVSDKVFGVTTEAVQVADDNEPGTISGLGTVTVVLATVGQVNRDIVEDNIGRTLTAHEVAGFAGTPLVLL